MDDYWWVVLIIVIILALAFWPITLCLGVAYGGYRIYKKNEMDTLNSNLSATEQKLSYTENEISAAKAQREDVNAKISSVGERMKGLMGDYVATKRFVTLFSSLGDSSSFPDEGLSAIQLKIEDEAVAHASLEEEGKKLDTKIAQLQRRSSELTSEIDSLKHQISGKK